MHYPTTSNTYFVCTSTSCSIFFNLKVRCCLGSAESSPLNLVAAGLVVTQVPASVSLYETNRKFGSDSCIRDNKLYLLGSSSTYLIIRNRLGVSVSNSLMCMSHFIEEEYCMD